MFLEGSTIAVPSDEESSKLVVVDLPGWEGPGRIGSVQPEHVSEVCPAQPSYRALPSSTSLDREAEGDDDLWEGEPGKYLDETLTYEYGRGWKKRWMSSIPST